MGRQRRWRRCGGASRLQPLQPLARCTPCLAPRLRCPAPRVGELAKLGLTGMDGPALPAAPRCRWRLAPSPPSRLPLTPTTPSTCSCPPTAARTGMASRRAVRGRCACSGPAHPIASAPLSAARADAEQHRPVTHACDASEGPRGACKGGQGARRAGAALFSSRGARTPPPDCHPSPLHLCWLQVLTLVAEHF